VIRVSGIAEILKTMAHVRNVDVLESFVFVEWPKIFSKQLILHKCIYLLPSQKTSSVAESTSLNITQWLVQ